MKLKALLILYLTITCGCAAGTKSYHIKKSFPLVAKLYPGATLSLKEISRIRVVNIGSTIEMIDGIRIYPIDYSDGFFKSEAHLLPGRHTITINRSRNFSSAGHEEATSTMSISTKAAHYYTIIYKDIGKEKVSFRIKDHGLDYDKRCGKLFDRNDAVTPVWLINKGNKVPLECY